MSVYGSLPAPDDDHPVTCAIYKHGGDGFYDFSGLPCDCGLPDAPIVYQGSNVIPSMDDERGGSVDLAKIPDWIRGVDGPVPFLRFGVNAETVVLDRRGVELVVATLTRWLHDLEGAA